MVPPPAQPSSSPAAPNRPASSQAWKLTLILDEQSIDWQRGCRNLVESYLASRHDLSADTEIVLNLIYHEVLLRRRIGGELPTLEEYVSRFPDLADALTIQFALDEALPHGESEEAPPPRDPSLPASVRIPGYEVIDVLGRGGMGVVYRARQVALNRTVALKMILDGAHASARQASRFRTEAEVFARLHHPGIVQIHEIGEHEGRPFLVLEFVAGGTLDRALAGTPMPADRAARLVETLARAVEHAHERGVVHRDLKPANVLLTENGEPKITDFGLAKLLAGDSHQSVSGALVGTPSYMAPEQVEGAPAVIGPSTDIYALGAILYEALTGRPPFRAESPMATMLQVRGAVVVAPRQLRPGLPPDLETICLKSLEKEPRRRYARAQDLADDLRRHLDGRPIVARPVPAWERLWLWANRQKALAAGILFSIMAILTMLGGVFYHTLQLSRLNTRLTSSNQELDVARASAEQNARDALAAITQMLVRVADQRLAGVPEAEPVRRDLLNDALKRLEPLQARNPTDPEIRHEIGRTHLGIAAIHKALGEFASAQGQCEQALSVLEPLLSDRPDDRRLQDTVADAHLALADLLSPERRQRITFFVPSRSGNRLPLTTPSSLGKLATSFYTVAVQKEGFGLTSASSYCERAIAMLERLAQDDPDSYNPHLARAIHNLGLFEGRVGHDDAAIKHFRHALDVWANIPADRKTETDDEGIAACQNALGMHLQNPSSNAPRGEAETMLRQAVESCRRLAKRHPGLLVHRAGLSKAWINLGSFYWRAERYAEAETVYVEALQAHEANVRDFPEVRAERIYLAHCYQNLADARSKQNKMKEANEGFAKALAVIEPVVAGSPNDFAALQCLATICLNHGNLIRVQSGAAAALPIQQRCVRAYEDAHRVAPDDAYLLTCLKGARGNLCTTYQELNRPEEALAELDAIIAVCEPKEKPAKQIVRGLILVRAGRHEQALTESRLVESTPGLDAESLYNLACISSLAVAAINADPKLDAAQKRERAAASTRDAIRLIDRADRDGHFPRKDLLDLLGKDTDLEPIRNTPEFKALLERLRG